MPDRMTSLPQPFQEDALKAAFMKGWDACWCRKPDAPFERDGGRQTAWEKHRAALLAHQGAEP